MGVGVTYPPFATEINVTSHPARGIKRRLVKMIRTKPLLIVDFTAGWCKPCAKMAPIFAGIAANNGDAATFVKVDIDDLPEAFDGMSIPAFHVSRVGRPAQAVTISFFRSHEDACTVLCLRRKKRAMLRNASPRKITLSC